MRAFNLYYLYNLLYSLHDHKLFLYLLINLSLKHLKIKMMMDLYINTFIFQIYLMILFLM